MTWKNRLKQLKHHWDNFFPSHDESLLQYATPIKKYWQPTFEPENLVNTDWLLKTGNGSDGWGNQELQHYSSDATNSFQYVMLHAYIYQSDLNAHADMLIAPRMAGSS